jgi:serine/threonine-protein kinase
VDVGIAAGATPFLVMELIHGGSLEDRRARFGDAAWARPIVRQIAAGLAALHANRIVHRDLKPGNVLLVENGAPSPPVAKISDFGISRFGALEDSSDVDVEGATAQPNAAHASPRDLTETGAIMGTPVYMPPEAWFGPARHPSADVFSLGVLAYETFTGRSPFAIPPVLLVRSRQPIPAPAPLDGVDPKIGSLVLACLQVEPGERPRAREIAEMLA